MRVLRVVWGLTLVAAPEVVLRAAGAPVDRRVTLVARVLGLRHLVQAAVVTPGSPLLVRRAAAATDVLHVASLAGAVVAPGIRRAALADGAVESVLTASSVGSAVRDA